MKQLLIIASLFIFISCIDQPKAQADLTFTPPEPTEQESPDLKPIFDALGVWGSTLILDSKNNQFLGHNFKRADSLYLPASTFKIPNTIIGYETKVITDETFWKFSGKKMQIPSWSADMNIQEAFKRSCVPCYQEVARKIGALKMNQYLESFNYGNNMDVSPENIDVFWLQGKSRISQRQQIEFLQEIYNENLPVSNPTIKHIKKIMVIEKKDNYTLSGKTGWSIRDGFNVGWFVGYIKTADNVYYFATNVEPFNQAQPNGFPPARTKATMGVFNALGLLK